MKEKIIHLCAASLRLVQAVDAVSKLGHITNMDPEKMLALLSFLIDLSDETTLAINEAMTSAEINVDDLINCDNYIHI